MAVEASSSVVSGLLDDPLVGVPPSSRARVAGRWERAVMRPDVDLGPLDELVREAALATEAPLATVSIMSDRQVLASVVYVDEYPVRVARGRAAPLEDTACLLTMRAGGTLAIVDTHEDARASSLPMARAEAFRAYLGVPLRAPGGEVVAVLCVYDHLPREWEPAHRTALERVAADVTATLAGFADDDA